MELTSQKSSGNLIASSLLFSSRHAGVPIDLRPRILCSKFPAADIPNLTFAEYVYGNIQKHSEKPYLIDGDTGATYTFGQIADLSRRLASALLRRGYVKDQVCCIFSSNCPEFMVTLLGIAASGLVPVLLNPALTTDEAVRHLTECEAVCIFASSDTVNVAFESAQKIPEIKGVYAFPDIEGNHSESAQPFTELTNDDGSLLTRLPSANDYMHHLGDVTAIMLYSSGTSGLPKCVQLTHRSVVANLCNSRNPELALYEDDDLVLCVLPMAHAYASLALSIPCLTRGIRVLVLRKYTFTGSLAAIEKFGATCFPVVPPIALRLMHEGDTTCSKYNLTSLTSLYCAAAPLSAEVEETLKSKFKLRRFRQLFGMTENSPLVSVSPKSNHKTGSVGKLYPGNEIMIADLESHCTLGAYERGEVWIRGPHITKGYLHNEEATRDMITSDGWMKTGDIGYFDEEDYLYLVDRKKEIIRYKATQVAPAELEALLLGHPGVLDVAVVGVPDHFAGELPRAYIVQCPAYPRLTEDDISEYVQRKAASFKHLRGGVEFVDCIPKSPTGKILRRILKQKYLDDRRKQTQS